MLCCCFMMNLTSAKGPPPRVGGDVTVDPGRPPAPGRRRPEQHACRHAKAATPHHATNARRRIEAPPLELTDPAQRAPRPSAQRTRNTGGTLAALTTRRGNARRSPPTTGSLIMRNAPVSSRHALLALALAVGTSALPHPWLAGWRGRWRRRWRRARRVLRHERRRRDLAGRNRRRGAGHGRSPRRARGGRRRGARRRTQPPQLRPRPLHARRPARPELRRRRRRVFTAFGESFGSGAHAAVAQPDGASSPSASRDIRSARTTRRGRPLYPDGSLDEVLRRGRRHHHRRRPETGAGRNDIARAVALQPDGRIVVAGETGGAFGTSPSSATTATGRSTRPSATAAASSPTSAATTRPTPSPSSPTGASSSPAAAGRAAPARTSCSSATRPTGASTLLRRPRRRHRRLPRRHRPRPGPRAPARRRDRRRRRRAVERRVPQPPAKRYGLAAAHFTAAGRLDPAFGDGGRVHLELLSSSGGYGLARLADGRVALAGHIGDEDFAVGPVPPRRAPRRALRRRRRRAHPRRPRRRPRGRGGSPRRRRLLVAGRASTEAGSAFAPPRYRAP